MIVQKDQSRSFFSSQDATKFFSHFVTGAVNPTADRSDGAVNNFRDLIVTQALHLLEDQHGSVFFGQFVQCLADDGLSFFGLQGKGGIGGWPSR